MNIKEYANYLIPNVKHEYDYYLDLYKKRNLKEGAYVLRSAPSPTGKVHIGSLMNALINTWFAKQTSGICYLRIEDTDQKRLIEDGINGIINDFNDLDIHFDEYPNYGEYGPYIQSERRDIYASFAKKLIMEGLAYPCFCSSCELDSIRKEQIDKKDRIGYYGKYAKCRDLTMDEAIARINNNEPYIIRLKSLGDFNKKIVLNDLIKGQIEMPENDIDVVIIKSDGLPTYHFAHAVDDFLMGTTHVIRGDEWLSSYPIHYELFKVLGFKQPKYAHMAPINIKEEDTVRKISKRKDPWARISYYDEMGIPTEALKLYIATLTNSNFEDWYNTNQDKDISDFTFSFKKMSLNGPIFDPLKLSNIAKTYISRLKADKLYEYLVNYTKKYDLEFYQLITKYKDYTIDILNIERNIKKPRKDFTNYQDIRKHIWYMYNELFNLNEDKYDDVEIKSYYNKDILLDYINNYYDVNDDKDVWYEKIKELGIKYNFCPSVKEYKENPSNYLGHVGDICELIRVCVTSLTMTPDLYEILRLLGKENINNRINLFNEYLDKKL